MNCEFQHIDNQLICPHCKFSMPYVEGKVVRNCANWHSQPSIAQKAVNLAGDLGKWAAAGFPVSAEEERNRKLSICQKCDRFDGQKCRECGCICSWATWLDTKKCPLQKW